MAADDHRRLAGEHALGIVFDVVDGGCVVGMGSVRVVEGASCTSGRDTRMVVLPLEMGARHILEGVDMDMVDLDDPEKREEVAVQDNVDACMGCAALGIEMLLDPEVRVQLILGTFP